MTTRHAGDVQTDSSADRIRLVAWRATGLAVLLGLAALAATADYWTSVGPDGGDVRCILPDRRNPSILYAAAFQSGLFRSVDSGDHWTPINEGLTVDGGDLNRSLVALAQSPEGTLYAASSGYIYKSQDGGDHWSGVPRAGLMALIRALAAGPSGLLLVGDRRGLFLTTDDGHTWVQAYGNLTEEIRAVAIHPGDPNTMYAGGPTSIGRSTDGGKSWQKVAGAVFQSLALDPDDPSIVYTADSSFFSKSTDRSASYQSVPTPSSTLRSVAVMKGSQPAIFAAADGDGIYRSLDDGKTWSRVFEGGYGVNVAVAGAAGAYVGTSARGVLRSLDRGETWTAVTSGFTAARVVRLAFHEGTDSPLLAGVYGFGVVRTTDGGKNWLAGPEAFGGLAYANFGCFAAAPGGSGVLYAGNESTVVRSQDNGHTWEQRSLPDIWACDSLAVDPADPSVLYLGNRVNRLYKSTDGGLTWLPSDSGLPNQETFQIAIDSFSPSTVFAVSQAGIYKTSDGGKTWRQSLDRWPTALAIAPGDHNTLYVDAFAYGIYKSSDGGETWKGPLSSELTDIVVLAVAPSDSSVVYAGTAYSGVYRSIDAGKTWTSQNKSLPPRWVMGLAIDSFGHVYSALDGAGVFLLQESLRPPETRGVRPPTRAVGSRK